MKRRKMLEKTLLGTFGFACSKNPFAPEEKKDLNDIKNNEWKTPENEAIVEEKMREAKEKLHTLEDVRELQSQFEYKSDYPADCPVDKRKDYDWTPTIKTLFYYDLHDDCDGAAVLGKWSLEQIKIPARILDLKYHKERLSHPICMSNDNHIFITNKHVCEIYGDKWVEAVFTFPLFKREYDALHDHDREKTYYRQHYVYKIQGNQWKKVEGIWRYNMK